MGSYDHFWSLGFYHHCPKKVAVPKKRSQFSRLQLLMPFGFSPVGAEAQAGKRLIVELSLEQGQGEVCMAKLRFFFLVTWGLFYIDVEYPQFVDHFPGDTNRTPGVKPHLYYPRVLLKCCGILLIWPKRIAMNCLKIQHTQWLYNPIECADMKHVHIVDSLWTILKWIRLRSCGTSVQIFTENRWQRWAAKSQWFFWGVMWLDQPEDSSTWTTLDELLQIVALRIWIFCRHPGFCHWHDLWFVAWLQQCQHIRCITGWCSW